MATNATDELQLEMAALPSAGSKPKLTRTGKILLGVTGATFVAVTAITTPFVVPALRKICLPYVPATTEQVQNVLSVLGGHAKGRRLIDLGSGDGRIAIEAARHGFCAEGIELNPWLVLFSRYRARREGLHRDTKFHTRDLWKHDLSSYDDIVVFGVDCMMEPLRLKLVQEMGDTCRVVACRFPVPSCEPAHTAGEGLDTVWLYTKSDLLRSVRNLKSELPSHIH